MLQENLTVDPLYLSHFKIMENSTINLRSNHLHFKQAHESSAKMEGVFFANSYSSQAHCSPLFLQTLPRTILVSNTLPVMLPFPLARKCQGGVVPTVEAINLDDNVKEESTVL